MTAEAIEHRTAHAPTREEVVLYNRRVSEAALRAADRRRREDDAPRLHDAVPALDSLRLEIEERRGGGVLAGGTHIRRIMVEHAPALFDLPCGDRTCKDGGHDLTRVADPTARLGEITGKTEAALAGEEVVFAKGGKPVVRLVPVQDEKFRFAVLAPGSLGDGPDFFAPMDAGQLSDWGEA